MTNAADTTNETRWASAEYNHSVAKLAWEAVRGDMDCSARQQVALALEDAKTSLYSVPAPDIGGVIKKLTMWWGETLLDDDYESSLNQRVIGDLTRIQLKNAGVGEREASGRTRKQAAAQAEAWRAALAEYSEQERLLMEDHETADIWAVQYAAGVLLELPAPSLPGVIRKLDLLWEIERLETVVDGAFYVEIMRDLNSLSRPMSLSERWRASRGG